MELQSKTLRYTRNEQSEYVVFLLQVSPFAEGKLKLKHITLLMTSGLLNSIKDNKCKMTMW